VYAERVAEKFERYAVGDSLGATPGEDLRMTVWMSEKMAVVAPMPSARVSMAVRVKTGERRIWRMA